jgi:hypothetical protein
MMAAIVLTHQLVLDAFYECSWTRGALQIEVRPTSLKGDQREFETCDRLADRSDGIAWIDGGRWLNADGRRPLQKD